MASYDSPGYMDRVPGMAVNEFTNAPGSPSPGAMPDTDSAGTAAEAGTVGNSAFVVPYGGSLVNGDRVDVGPADVLVSTQAVSYGPAADPMTGIGSALGQTGAGAGTPRGPGNPNAIGTPSLTEQITAARETYRG